MSHGDAFLQAILAEPDDDAPRLIYADWLEERGDPRGAFIRLQCALERFGPFDPARPDLEDEASELLYLHEEEWTAPLRGIASPVAQFESVVSMTAAQLLDPSFMSRKVAFDSNPKRPRACRPSSDQIV